MAKLYVVATPIGNLSDLTPRMRDALEQCDLIAAEDTRVTMKLLNHFDIKKPLVSCHRHNEDMRAPALISRMLEEDLTVALTCDAGTPAISDPGNVIVAAAWEAGIPVIPISGPSATVTALSAAGFDAREFAFYGFLPREKKALREKLASIQRTGISIAVIYESPHRVAKLVGEMAEAWPGQRACVCCDLTKKYEKLSRGTLDELARELSENPNAEKGEYCIVAEVPAPVEEKTFSDIDAATYMLQEMLRGAELSEAAEAAAGAGYARNDIYRAKIDIKRRFDE